MSSPLTLHASPSAGFDEPFEMLAACHDRVRRMVELLERLSEHLHTVGCDRQAQDAARDVMRYFDQAAPAHHEDEERHVVPLLRAAGDDAFAAQLEQEHRELQRRWAELRRPLLDVAAGSWVATDASERASWQRFAELYRAHAASEEAHAFPLAQAALDHDAQRAMGREMAARRGVPG
jgi:hemerythrin-like domain-containing protein